MLLPPVRHLVGDPAEIAFEPHVVSGLGVEEPRVECVRQQQSSRSDEDARGDPDGNVALHEARAVRRPQPQGQAPRCASTMSEATTAPATALTNLQRATTSIPA